MRTGRALLAGAVLLAAAPGLHAACDDPPEAEVDWSGCSKQRLMIRKKSLQGARFDHSTLIAMNFDGSDLNRASFAAAEISRSSFRDAAMEGANLTKVVSVRSNFSGARLAGADLEKAEFHRSILTRAGLRRANLSKGDFGRSIFERADLRDANLKLSSLARASFREARLAGADVSQAFMFGTHVEGTDLSAVKGLVQAQVDVACGDAKTILPPGLKAPASWPCAD
jgi:uncharacterized protein YjbI with pentapeptide repeats